jgi:hypothetical protein
MNSTKLMMCRLFSVSAALASSLFFLTAQAEPVDPAAACERIRSPALAADCRASVDGHYIEPLAAAACDRLRSASLTAACFSAISDRRYTPDQTAACDDLSFASETVECFLQTGRSVGGWERSRQDPPPSEGRPAPGPPRYYQSSQPWADSSRRREGGGCNSYGCWHTPFGSCNSYGCSELGACNSYGCPKPGRPGGGCNSYGCWSGGGGCNSYGCWSGGGGCNSYGCWNTPSGSCNSYGCSSRGACNSYGCP